MQDNPDFQQGVQYAKTRTISTERIEQAKKELAQHEKTLAELPTDHLWYASEVASVQFYKGFLSIAERGEMNA